MTTRKTFSKFMVALMAALLLVTAAFAPAPALAAEGEDYIVTVSALNLRTGPGFEFPVLRLLTQGQRMTLQDLSNDGRWSEVRLPEGLEGWVFNAYIELASEADEGASYVLISQLNLRVGPGVNYWVLRVLTQGTSLTVTGRSLTSDWLVVELADGTEGWVFSPFIQTDAEVADLPVMEAFGGPTSGGTVTTPVSTSLLVTIRNNVAVVDVRGFAAKTDLSVYLGVPGEDLDLKVTSGTTLGDGSARMTFEMPAKWSDGSKVTQQNLAILVKAEDSSKSLKANIIYLR